MNSTFQLERSIVFAFAFHFRSTSIDKALLLHSILYLLKIKRKRRENQRNGIDFCKVEKGFVLLL